MNRLFYVEILTHTRHTCFKLAHFDLRKPPMRTPERDEPFCTYAYVVRTYVRTYVYVCIRARRTLVGGKPEQPQRRGLGHSSSSARHQLAHSRLTSVEPPSPSGPHVHDALNAATQPAQAAAAG